MTADLKPCEAFAIVGPDGKWLHVALVDDETAAWLEFTECIPQNLIHLDEGRAEGFDAIPVTITHSAQPVEADNEICPFCEKPINNLAGNPAMWGVGLHFNGCGKNVTYHQGCVSERLRAQPAEAMRLLGEARNAIASCSRDYNHPGFTDRGRMGPVLRELLKRIDSLLGGTK